MQLANPLTFKGYPDFSLGQVRLPIGKHAADVPVMLWNGDHYPRQTIKQKKTKKISLVSLPDQTVCILKKNRQMSPKLAEKGAQLLHRLLGFNHMPASDLACHPAKTLQPGCAKDIVLLQEHITGVTVQEGLNSPRWRELVNQALDNPMNLIPLYLQMVISGDSDRHDENMSVDKQGKLWSYDYEFSGGHDFYTYPDYESFTVQPEVEDRFARETPLGWDVLGSLKQFVKNRHENEDKLAPYYGYRRLKGFFERADILRELGKLIPTPLLFPMLRGTFYPPEELNKSTE